VDLGGFALVCIRVVHSPNSGLEKTLSGLKKRCTKIDQCPLSTTYVRNKGKSVKIHGDIDSEMESYPQA